MQNKLKICKTLFLLFAISFLAIPTCIGQTGGVHGHISIKSTGDSAVIKEHVMVWLKHDGEQWWITGLDSNFNFYFDFLRHHLKPDTTEIRITTIDKYKDTIVSNIILNETKITYIDIPYPPYCEFDKTKNDSICSVCKKSDQVSRIIYEAFANPPKRKRKQKKYWTEHNFITGCDPHWFCKRDDKIF